MKDTIRIEMELDYDQLSTFAAIIAEGHKRGPAHCFPGNVSADEAKLFRIHSKALLSVAKQALELSLKHRMKRPVKAELTKIQRDPKQLSIE